jgi:hypothetical protein
MTTPELSVTSWKPGVKGKSMRGMKRVGAFLSGLWMHD